MNKMHPKTEEFLLTVQIMEVEKTLKMLEGLVKHDKKARLKRALADISNIVGNLDEREDVMQFSDIVGEFFQEFRISFNKQLEENATN
jgi:hypothetical protein